jgi:hypothetical protein
LYIPKELAAAAPAATPTPPVQIIEMSELSKWNGDFAIEL